MYQPGIRSRDGRDWSKSDRCDEWEVNAICDSSTPSRLSSDDNGMKLPRILPHAPAAVPGCHSLSSRLNRCCCSDSVRVSSIVVSRGYRSTFNSPISSNSSDFYSQSIHQFSPAHSLITVVTMATEWETNSCGCFSAPGTCQSATCYVLYRGTNALHTQAF